MFSDDAINNLRLPLESLKAMLTHAPVGIQIYSGDGHSLWVNGRFLELFGEAPPPHYCVLEDPILKEAGVLEEIREAFQGKVKRLPPVWYDPRDLKNYDVPKGRRCAVESTYVPIMDGSGKVENVMIMFQDVTLALQSAKERDDAKLLFQDILSQMRAVIYMKNMDGRYVLANGEYEPIVGIPASKMLGRLDEEVFPPETASQLKANDKVVLETGEHVEREEPVRHPDGKVHTYLSTKFPVRDSEGKLIGVCGISTDMTRYRAMERELNTAKRMEAVGLLAGGIAHDFHNNLGIILLVAETLLMSEGDQPKEGWRTSVEAIRSAARSAALLTRQLLAFGRRQTFQPRVIDIGQIARGMHEILQNALGEDVRFSLDVEEDLPPVFMDPMQVEQVLANLCFNARDALPRGGLIEIGLRRIGQDGVELMVRDNGVGMSAEVQEHVFEPFFTTKKEGTGLGLSTVHGIVESAGGRISFESVPGQGSTFLVWLPRATSEAAVVEIRSRSEAPRGSERVLLVEDKGELREITAGLLRAYGYKVSEAWDAESALLEWDRGGKIDMVITDIIMPGMSGVDLAVELDKRGRPPMLFVSAYSETRLADYSFDRKDAYFLQKPFTADELLLKIREVLKSHSGK